MMRRAPNFLLGHALAQIHGVYILGAERGRIGNCRYAAAHERILYEKKVASAMLRRYCPTLLAPIAVALGERDMARWPNTRNFNIGGSMPSPSAQRRRRAFGAGASCPIVDVPAMLRELFDDLSGTGEVLTAQRDELPPTMVRHAAVRQSPAQCAGNGCLAAANGGHRAIRPMQPRRPRGTSSA